MGKLSGDTSNRRLFYDNKGHYFLIDNVRAALPPHIVEAIAQDHKHYE